MNFKNSFLLSILVIGLTAYVTADGEAKPNIKIYVEKPIIHEVSADSVKQNDVVEAVPIVKSDNLIKPVEELQKAEVDKSAADLLNKKDETSIKMTPIDKPAEPVKQDETESVNVQLPPMPLILPSFLSNFPPLPPFLKSIMENKAILNQDNNNDLNDSSEELNDQDNDSSDEVGKNDQSSSLNPISGKHGFMSIFLFKSNKNPTQQEQGQDESSSSGAKANLLIMKILPRPILGGDSDPDNSKKTVHLMGGPSDPDHSPNFNKIHLFGGDSDSAERFRFGNNDMGMMTGNEDSKINAFIQERHESVMDKIKNFFNFRPFFHPIQQNEEKEPPQFIIRTDDGSPAFISNDIGAGSDLPMQEQQEQSKKTKCMMLSFMRLKASAYYRTIVHLLFFTGIALFILLVGLLTMRTFKTRRNGFRYHAQKNMNIASIDGTYPTKTASNRLSWFKDSLATKTSDLSSSLANQSLLMPQPPPAYDQVLITTGDNESIVKQIPPKSDNSTNSLANAYKNKYQNVKDEDQKSIISMPPGYEDVNKE